jgi:hypothetical protein
LDGKIRGLNPRAVDDGATGPPFIGGHCCTWELTGARPLATSVPKSSSQGAGEGKEGPTSSTAGSPRARRQWRGVSLAVADSAMAVMVVELGSGGNERGGGTPGQCEGGGVLRRVL